MVAAAFCDILVVRTGWRTTFGKPIRKHVNELRINVIYKKWEYHKKQSETVVLLEQRSWCSQSQDQNRLENDSPLLRNYTYLLRKLTFSLMLKVKNSNIQKHACVITARRRADLVRIKKTTTAEGKNSFS